MRSYQVFIFTTLLFFTLLLAWVGLKRYGDFVEYHTIVSTQTTAGIADEIARIIAEKKRLIAIFAKDNSTLLAAQILQPENDYLHELIEKGLKEHFPYFFTFTLADADGSPFLDDFDGNMNEQCQNDIRLFALRGIHHPRIHPNPNAYHFDAMATIPGSKQEHILFVSFRAELLAKILSYTQPPSHNLILTFNQDNPLIEITSVGARNKIDRNNYHLTPQELKHLLHRRAIAGTSWEVLDLHDPSLFKDFIWNLVVQSLLMFIPFMVFALIMRHLFAQEERLRRSAETARDEFLSTVSHELRTPLTAIQGSLGLIANGITGEVTKKTADLINIANKNCKRLVLLVNDLLDMRKLETGKMDYKMHPLEVTPLLETTLEENSNYAQQFNCSFEFEPLAEPIKVMGDENRLMQVMTNLLSNAAKYGRPNDTIRIKVDKLEHIVRISVRDNGPGIPTAYQNKIFEKFIRVSGSDRQSAGGSGLGLSIVRTIVENHGGKVGFRSTVGKGTTFYFELPIAQPPSAIGT